MLNKVRYALTTATIKQSLITVVSTVTTGGLAVIFYLLVARSLGPAQYGIFSLIVATAAIMTVVFDFGNDRGMVKFISRYQADPHKMRQILKISLLTKLISGAVVITLCIVYSQSIAQTIFNQPQMAEYIPLIALAFASQLLFYFVSYYFQAREQFVWWGLTFVGTNFVRLVLTFVVMFFGHLDTSAATWLFIATPLLVFIIGMKKIGWNFLRERVEKQVIFEVFSFNKWVIGFSAVSTISSRLDTYLTSYLLKLSDVGVYGLANQAVVIMPNLVSALGAVTSPKFSRFDNAKHNQTYLKKSLLFFCLVSLGSVVLLLPVGIGFMLFSGSEYLSGLYPFLIILLSQGLFMASTPIRDSLLYYYSKPQFFFWAGIGQGITAITVGVWLIPTHGLLGAALSNFAGQFLLSISATALYLRLSTKK